MSPREVTSIALLILIAALLIGCALARTQTRIAVSETPQPNPAAHFGADTSGLPTAPPEVSIAQARAAVRFKIKLPSVTLGQTLRGATVVDAPAGQQGGGAVLRFDDLQLAEQSYDTTAEAQVGMDNALPGGAFDSRFMSRTKIAGLDAIYWNATDIPGPGGVHIPDSGVLFRDGTTVYNLLALRKLDRDALAKIAASLN